MTERTHSGEHEEILERYLRGELPLDEMEAFERAVTERPDLAESAVAYSELLDNVAAGLDGVVPPVGENMRSRILSIADAKPISQVIRAAGGQWVESGVDGIKFKLLYQDSETNKMTVLARIGAGGRMPAHRHQGVEECLVIEGNLWTDGVFLQAGDYIVTQDQTVHEDTWSPDGALVLLKTFMADEMLVP